MCDFMDYIGSIIFGIFFPWSTLCLSLSLSFTIKNDIQRFFYRDESLHHLVVELSNKKLDSYF